MTDQKTLNTLVKGAGWTAIGMVVSKVLTYFYRAAVARLEGPAAYGQLSLAITVLSMTGTIALLANNQAIKKFIPDYRAKGEDSKARGVVIAALQMTMPLAVLGGFILYFSSGFIASEIFESQGLAEIIKILALVPPFALLSRISISTLVAHKKIKYRIITNQFFQNVAQLAFTIPLLLFGMGVVGAAWGWFAGSALSALLAFYFMESKVGPYVFTSKKALVNKKKVLKYSYPLLFSAIVVSVLGWSDNILLAYFMTDATVGLYNAAMPIANLIMLPYKAFKSLALPSLSEKVGKGEKLGHVLKTLTRWTFYISFPVFAMMSMFSEQILHLLFGQNFTSASTAMVVLAGGYLISVSTGHLDQVLKSISETKILLKNTVANTVLNIALNLILIPEEIMGIEMAGLGLLGAALATTISIVFVNTLLIIEVYHFRDIHPFSADSWKALGSIAPALSITYVLFSSIFRYTPLWALIPAGLLFMSIYTVTLVLLKGIKDEDKQIIVNIGRKMGREKEARRLADILSR